MEIGCNCERECITQEVLLLTTNKLIILSKRTASNTVQCSYNIGYMFHYKGLHFPPADDESLLTAFGLCP